MAKERNRRNIDVKGDGTVSRRQFIQDAAIMTSIITGAAAFPTRTAAGAPLTPVAIPVLTPEQTDLLTAILNELIPPDGHMPGAGDLGVAMFINDVIQESPDLKAQIVGVLTQIKTDGGGSDLSGSNLATLLQHAERCNIRSFEVLLQAAYVGYYSDSRVVATIQRAIPAARP